MKIIKWEYKCFSSAAKLTSQDFEAKANAKGAEGWEFCSVIILGADVFYLFKRPCGYCKEVLE
jgi:hypothetical protein